MAKHGKKEGEAFSSLTEAARFAGLSRPTLTKHLHEIPHRVAGRRVLITKAALTRWLEGDTDK